MAEPKFATFWDGRLSPFETACIASYSRRGYDIAVYSYHPLAGLPEAARAADAAEIASAEAMARFIYAGKPNLSHFSDYFRYQLFAKTDYIWVDADMLLVRRIDEALPDTLLAREWQPSICGAVMRIGSNHEHLPTLIAKTEAAAGRDLLWGETGPLLLTKTFGREGLLRQALKPSRFFPIRHDDFWKVFLPDYRAECEALAADAWGVHLWNNVVERLGIWKEFAPPVGSYLHSKFEVDGSIGYFRDAYPAHIVEQMVENWRLRKTGGDLGLKQLTRQAIPSIGRTIRHYRK